MKTPGTSRSRPGCRIRVRVEHNDADGVLAFVLVGMRRRETDPPNAFLHALGARGLSPQSIRAYAFDLVALYRWLRASKRELTALDQADLLELIRALRASGASPRTINRRLVTARQLYRFCTDQDVPGGPGTSLPAAHYRGRGKDRRVGIHELPRRSRLKLRVAVARRLVEPLNREQVGLVLRSIRRYRDLEIVQLMLLCGLRSAEVLSLKLADVSYDEGQVRVSGKGGLANANAHRFRHTFGADMARAGVRLPVLQKMMGHQDPSMTLQYINLSMADVAAEFQRANAEIQRRYDEEQPA